MYETQVSLLDYLQISDTLKVILTILFLILAFVPLFHNQKIGNMHIPSANRKVKTISFLIGISGIAFVMIGGIVPIDFRGGEKIPYCRIETHGDGDRQTVMNWYASSRAQTEELSISVLKNDIKIGTDRSGTSSIRFSPDQEKIRYSILAQNVFGACRYYVDVFNPDSDADDALECSIKISKEVARIGDEYNVRWQVSGPEDVVVFINGAEVKQSGSANFTFTGPNYDRFRMVANLFGQTCHADAIILGS